MFIQRVVALLFLTISLPLVAVLYIVVKTTSQGSFLFVQKRMGKGMRPFWIYKIRTMVEGADSLKSQVQSLNEADGPVFKIRHDPRYTPVGKILSHLAIDELPQLINVINGEMALVGPRPLPVAEAKKVPKKYHARFTVLPGMTSSWIVNGAHALSFKRWMELDCEYAHNRNILTDLKILLSTVRALLTATFSHLKSK